MALFDEYQFISLKTSGGIPPASDPFIQLVPAADPPSPGNPGGEAGDLHLVRTGDTTQLIVSLGNVDKLSPEAVRKAGGAVARWLHKNHVEKANLDLASLARVGIDRAVRSIVEGLCLGAFRFERYKKEEQTAPRSEVTLFPADEETRMEVERTVAVCGAVNLARAWGHEPANVLNPITLAERSRDLASQAGIKFSLLDEHKLAEIGAGGILNVGKGSQSQPRLIILEYPGRDAGTEKPVVLVGKAITFDTGGYSIKDVTNIQGMKYDKCGGMAVIAILAAAAALKIRQPLVGIISAAENMISAQAYRPDDIITTLAGKTVEILTTDAEGRLVLADGLTYGQRSYQPKVLIDLATLTGGVVVALGRVRAGMMANDDQLADALSVAGDAVYERLWRLPLDEEYFQNIKGDEADLKNSGGREGHAIFGGMFLKQFVDDGVPWAHLDIAGLADTNKELPYCPKGATGFGVRLLIEYLEKG